MSTTTTTITQVDAWEALDSRGTPTVACAVTLSGGTTGECAAPSGASTGRHEAHELRDGGTRYGGRGVRQAVTNVHRLAAPAVIGVDAADQEAVDAALLELDPRDDLGTLGANAALAVSVAAACAAARAHRVPLHAWLSGGADPLLPMPMVNILSGGAHAGGAIDLQDLLVVPVGAGSFAEAIEWCWRVRRAAAQELEDRGHGTALVADEGGLAAPLPGNREAFEVLTAALDRSGLAIGAEVAIAVDVAASQFFDGQRYQLRRDGAALSSEEMVEQVAAWCAEFPVVSVEDPLAEDDWDAWVALTARLGSGVQVLGDDLFVTTRARVERGIGARAGNAVLVKPNQTGVLSRASQVCADARTAGWRTVVSARSGETEDTWLADLAVGWRAGQIKVGSLMRAERTAKWNRLLRIEHEAGSCARFADDVFPRPEDEA